MPQSGASDRLSPPERTDGPVRAMGHVVPDRDERTEARDNESGLGGSGHAEEADGGAEFSSHPIRHGGPASGSSRGLSDLARDGSEAADCHHFAQGRGGSFRTQRKNGDGGRWPDQGGRRALLKFDCSRLASIPAKRFGFVSFFHVDEFIVSKITARIGFVSFLCSARSSIVHSPLQFTIGR